MEKKSLTAAPYRFYRARYTIYVSPFLEGRSNCSLNLDKTMLGFISNITRDGPSTVRSSFADIVCESEVARVTVEIPAGDVGRVHYQATEWNARSVDGALIATNTIVRPVLRKGNTWYVSADQHVLPQTAA